MIVFGDVSTDDGMDLGSRIKSYRKAMNMSQAELAEAVGVSRATVSAIENNTAKLSFDCLLQIAELLDMPTAYLFMDRKFSSVLVNIFSGRTKIDEKGQISGSGLISVSSDYSLDNDFVCVTDGDRIYLATRKILVGAKRFLCNCGGVCRIAGNDTASRIATVIADVTENARPIFGA